MKQFTALLVALLIPAFCCQSAFAQDQKTALVPLPSVADFSRGENGWSFGLGLGVEYESAYEGSDDNPDQWYWFEGNFESYEENKIARLGAEAAKPHRSTYRRLTRD